MKTLITYYSYSGNTDKIAQVMAMELKKKGDVDIQRLRPIQEINDFVGQCKVAFTRKRTDLEREGDIKFDVSHYDLILIGSPVWAFAPTPAMNTYLDKINGLHGKKAVVFLTSGSGLGVKKCFKNIRRVLESKGAFHIDEINIRDRKVNDEDFIKAAYAHCGLL